MSSEFRTCQIVLQVISTGPSTPLDEELVKDRTKSNLAT